MYSKGVGNTSTLCGLCLLHASPPEHGHRGFERHLIAGDDGNTYLFLQPLPGIHGTKVRARSEQQIDVGAHEAALAELDDLEWSNVRDVSKKTPTTLGPIGVDAAAAILQHAYAVTRVNLYLNLRLGTLPDPSSDSALDPFRRRRFEHLLAES